MNEHAVGATMHRTFDQAAAAALSIRPSFQDLESSPASEPHRSAPVHIAGVPGAAPSTRDDLPLDQITFRRLESAGEIARIAHLREEIQLPAATLADPVFRTREKKETKSVSSALSSAAAC